MKTVGYPDDCLTIQAKVITDTLRLCTFLFWHDRKLTNVDSVLQKAGVVKGEFDVSQFVDTAVVTLA